MKNILSIDHVIYPGMIVLKAEGIHFDPVTIREIWDKNGILYIKIKNNKTGKVETISSRIDVDLNTPPQLEHSGVHSPLPEYLYETPSYEARICPK